MEMKNLYLTIINNLRDGVYYVNTEREILFWNDAAEKITGYAAQEVIGKKCDGLLKHIDENGCPLCTAGCPLYETIIDGTQRSLHAFISHKDSYRLPVLVNTFPICKDDKIIGAAEIFSQDSSAQYESNLVEHLSSIAMHDALTQLPNRRYLDSFLNYRLDEFKCIGRQFAVLFADIDDFSNLNNTYGHEAGDGVLIHISKSIQQNIRKDDFVGRWGGEEIVGIYPISRSEEAKTLGEKFRQIIENTEISYDSKKLKISVSVGVTVVRNDDSVASIVKRADMLMYQSKKDGKNCVTFG